MNKTAAVDVATFAAPFSVANERTGAFRAEIILEEHLQGFKQRLVNAVHAEFLATMRETARYCQTHSWTDRVYRLSGLYNAEILDTGAAATRCLGIMSPLAEQDDPAPFIRAMLYTELRVDIGALFAKAFDPRALDRTLGRELALGARLAPVWTLLPAHAARSIDAQGNVAWMGAWNGDLTPAAARHLAERAVHYLELRCNLYLNTLRSIAFDGIARAWELPLDGACAPQVENALDAVGCKVVLAQIKALSEAYRMCTDLDTGGTNRELQRMYPIDPDDPADAVRVRVCPL